MLNYTGIKSCVRILYGPCACEVLAAPSSRINLVILLGDDNLLWIIVLKAKDRISRAHLQVILKVEPGPPSSEEEAFSLFQSLKGDFNPFLFIDR